MLGDASQWIRPVILELELLLKKTEAHILFTKTNLHNVFFRRKTQPILSHNTIPLIYLSLFPTETDLMCVMRIDMFIHIYAGLNV